MNHQDKEAPFHLAGWVLFLLCAFLFLYVAVREHDVILALASLVFLAGCIAFLIPLVFPVTADKGDTMEKQGGSFPEKDEKP